MATVFKVLTFLLIFMVCVTLVSFTDGTTQGPSTPDCTSNTPNITNGNITLSEGNKTTFKATANVNCNDGYKASSETITCKSTGKWSNATCNPKDCTSNTPNITNGNITLSEGNKTTFKATANVNCNDGYKASSETITCKSTGKWSNATCNPKDCTSNTPNITNGNITLSEGNKTTFKATANVNCNDGYKASSETIICKSTGKWSNATCNHKDCTSNTPNITNGNITLSEGNKTTFKATANVNCNDGYKASSETIICKSTEKWSNATCNPKDCTSNTPNITNGNITLSEGNKTTFKATANVNCNDGYKASSETIICKSTGKWSNATCNPKECTSNTPNITNGNITLSEGNKTTFKATANVNCNDGYKASSETITCKSTGKWSNATCNPKDCTSNTPNITNGNITLSEGNKTTFKATANVNCNDGYKASSETITCKSTGKWSNATCNPKDCTSNTPNITNGNITLSEGNKTTFKATANVNCNDGYKASSETITCKSTGKWSNSTCNPKDCTSNTPNITNGNITLSEGNKTTFKATANVNCNDGYKASSETITCKSTEKWSNATCNPKDCTSNTPNITNGNITLSEGNKTTFKATANVNCNDGYKASSETITCKSTGKWSNATCNPKDCTSNTPNITNGNITLSEGNKTTFKATANVNCNDGYKASSETITCKSTGKWSNATCNPKDCTSNTPNITNGNITLSEGNKTTFKATANVNCNDAYKASSETITCKSTGKWSNATCNPKDCTSNTPNITHGNITLSDGNKTTFKATANVNCNDGYKASSETITCQSTGKWSNATCNPKDVKYNETCYHIENTCITPNTTCSNDTNSAEARCLCKHDFVYVEEKDECFEKLNIEMSVLRLEIYATTSNFMKLRWNTPTNFSLKNLTFVFKLTNLQSNGIRSCDVPVVEKQNYYDKKIEMLQPGTKYSLTYYVTNNDGVPSKDSKTIIRKTAPLPPDSIDITNVTENGFTVTWTYNNTLSFDENKIVIEPASDGLNCSFSVHEHGSCLFARNDSTTSVDIWGLVPGTMYTATMYTIFETVQSLTNINKTSFTIPVLPNKILAPLQSRKQNSFNISFEDANPKFKWWIVTVLENSTLKFEKNKTSDVHEILFDTLDPGTLYIVKIKTWVPGFESTSENVSRIYTRPSDLKSISIPKELIYEKNFTFTYETFDENYDGIEITICHGNDSLICNGIAFTQKSDAHTYIVQNLTVSTNYTVCVRTALHSATPRLTSWNFMNMSSYTAPERPNAELQESDFRSVTLNLAGNENKKFDHYWIVFEDDDKLVNNKTLLAAENKIANIDNLKPGTLYMFRIYSVLSEITSEFYQDLRTYTRPLNVTSMSVKSTTNSSMKVQWQSPPEGRVDRYKVTFNCVSPNKGSQMQKVHNYSGPNLIFNIEQLDPGTYCSANMTTFVGEAEKIEQEGKSTELKLNATTNEMAPGSVILDINETDKRMFSLTWLNPQISNGIIRKYKLIIKDIENDSCLKRKYVYTNCSPELCNESTTYCNDVDVISEGKACQDSRNETELDIGALSQTVSELHPFWNYSIELQAFTRCWGTITSTYLKTMTDRPVAFPILTKNETTESKISLKWKELDKEDQNGYITWYFIKYSYSKSRCSNPANGEIIETVLNVTGNTLEEDIPGLRPFWYYDIAISASTSAGEGNYSAPISLKTKESEPGKIEHETINSTSYHSANVSWSVPCRTNGILTGFVFNILNKDNNSGWLTNSAPEKSESTEYVIQNLRPYSNYSVQIAAKNIAGQGNFSEGVTFRTQIGKPEQPIDTTVKESNSTSLKISWKTPNLYTGPTKYIVVVQDTVNRSMTTNCETEVDFNASECIKTGLDEYWNYTITVVAKTGSFETSSIPITGQTAQDKPGIIRMLQLKSEKDILKERSINVTWNEPSARDKNGKILQYYVEFKDDNNKIVRSGKTDHLAMKYDYSGLNLHPGKYWVQVFAATSVGNGTKVTKNVTVEAGAPLKVNEETETGLLMKPSDKKPDDTETQIAVQLPLKDFLCNPSNGKLTTWGIIVAQNGEATDESFSGSMISYQKRISNVYKTWFDVNDMDSIKPYLATYLDLKESCANMHVGNRKKRDVNKENYSGYKKFTVGLAGKCSGKQKDKYCNGELQPGRSYRVKTFACTVGGCTETKYSEPISTDPNLTVPIAAGISSAVIVIAIVAVVIFILRRKQLICFAKDDESLSTHTPGEGIHLDKIENKKKNNFSKPGQGPIKLSNLPDAVEKFHRDSDLLFADAYKMLKEKSPSHPMTAAEQQCCRPKNRYTNILPFDHSRVKLRPSDDMEGSDYINANYIPGYTSRREYIAAQGPMIATFDDFWRMVWEQNVDTIVMLTKLMEKGRHKCDKYWPDLGEPVFYGDLVVSLQSESNLSDYTIKIFEIKMGIKQKKIKHFHFLQWPDFGCPDKHWPVINFISMVRQYRPPFPKGPLLVHCSYLKWPDMGCPETPELLLEFVKAVKQYGNSEQKPSSGPTIVHCSAGVGRTGTFIAVDYLLQHIRDHDEVDIFNLVLEMRNHRLNMVQTEDQFIYIHECVKSFITTDEEEEDDEAVYENTGFGADEEENVYVNT